MNLRYSFPALIPAVLCRFSLFMRRMWFTIRTPLLCKIWGVKVGKNVLFQGFVLLRTHGNEIQIGDHTTFLSDPKANLVGLMNPTILDTLKGGCIIIGSHCGFSSPVLSSRKRITIGNRVLVGGNVRIFDHDYHSINAAERGTSFDFSRCRAREVVIQDDVFIGTNAIILKGTVVGARSVISAGSVVFGLNIPPDSLVKGNPAVVFKRVDRV